MWNTAFMENVKWYGLLKQTILLQILKILFDWSILEYFVWNIITAKSKILL